MRSDIEIAREARLRPIAEVAAGLGLTADELHAYGPYMAKVPLGVMERLAERPDGKLILVTAMTPTKHGEGKTTTTIGLTQALARLGQRAVAAIREPSLGPCMGLKGGAAGGGYAQVLPMEEINLHFTGDLHAVTAAHNLLAAVPATCMPSPPPTTCWRRWWTTTSTRVASPRFTRVRCCGSGSST